MSESKTVRHYTSDAIDVTYEARRCIHAAECLHGLPAVFDTARRPWILPTGASADAIAAVIAKCPSGALHYARRDGGAAEAPLEPTTIVPTPGGPLYVRGRVRLRSADGRGLIEETRLALCRCGQSRNKPFCDDSHRASGFADPGAVADGGAAASGTATIGDDDQIVPIGASAHRSVDLVKGSTLTDYPGGDHGLAATHTDRLNADLPAFAKG